MMPSKLRRHIDLRSASFAREIAQLAAKDPRLRFPVLGVAIACIGLGNQMQQIAASCKNAQQAFEAAFPDDSESKNHAKELFENLGSTILHASEGAMTEALETLIVIAIHTSDNDAEARVLSMQAQSLGLDTADIALDEEEVPKQDGQREEERPGPTTDRTHLSSSEDRLRISAVAQVAIARKLPLVGVEAQGSNLVLVGYTQSKSRADRLCVLDCDAAEGQKIAVSVMRIVQRAGIED